MKKSAAIISLLLPVLLICSCGSINNSGTSENNSSNGQISVPDRFKEFSFNEKVPSVFVYEITSNASNNLYELSKVTTTSQQYYRSSISETNSLTTKTVNFYEDENDIDLLLTDSLTITDNYSCADGVTFNEKVREEYAYWDTGYGYGIQIDNYSSGEMNKQSIQRVIYEGSTSQEIKQRYMRSKMTATYNDSCFFLNADGSYTYVDSHVNKYVSGYSYGNDTKDYRRTERRQDIRIISKDFYLLEVYSYGEIRSNQDNTTKEFLDSEELCDYYYSETKYEYNKKEKKSQLAFYSLLGDKKLVVDNQVRRLGKEATITETGYTFGEEETEYSCGSVYYESDPFPAYNGTFSGNFNLRFDGDYSTNPAGRLVLDVSTLSKTGIIETNTYNIVLSEDYVLPENEVRFDLVNYNSYLYFICLLRSYFRVYLTFDGNSAFITKIIY